MDFDAAFVALIGVEKGYSNDPLDPGGATCWGVTEVVARAEGYAGDMQDYPLEDAKALYRKRYWDEVNADSLPDAVRYSVFDAAVNSGVAEAKEWLQQAAGVTVDRNIGPATLAACSTRQDLVQRFNGLRLQYMTNLHNWDHDGKGWARRIAKNLLM